MRWQQASPEAMWTLISETGLQAAPDSTGKAASPARQRGSAHQRSHGVQCAAPRSIDACTLAGSQDCLAAAHMSGERLLGGLSCVTGLSLPRWEVRKVRDAPASRKMWTGSLWLACRSSQACSAEMRAWPFSSAAKRGALHAQHAQLLAEASRWYRTVGSISFCSTGRDLDAA